MGDRGPTGSSPKSAPDPYKAGSYKTIECMSFREPGTNQVPCGDRWGSINAIITHPFVFIPKAFQIVFPAESVLLILAKARLVIVNGKLALLVPIS